MNTGVFDEEKKGLERKEARLGAITMAWMLNLKNIFRKNNNDPMVIF
jgi:hypothetical protein